MASLKQIRTRISSVKNIQRVTRAMQLVAAARMRRAQEAIFAARPYAQHLDRVLQHVSSNIAQYPLMAARPVLRTAILVVTSDRGLCGSFNTNVCRLAQGNIGPGDCAIAVGRKGRNYFLNRSVEVASEYLDVFRHLSFAQAVAIAEDAVQRFLSGQVDRVMLAYNEFVSVAQQRPALEQLLPLEPKFDEDAPGHQEYLFEPSSDILIQTLIPRRINFHVWRALLESNAGEQAARMRTMDSATKNAGDMIEALTREMNKERQSSITLELMDIIGGAEAVAQ